VAIVFLSGWIHANTALLAEIIVNILLGFSLQVVLRAGVFSVAGVGFFTVGAYTAGILAVHGVAAPLAILLGIIGTMVCGYLISIPLLRLSGHYLAIATIAFDLVVTVIASSGGKLTGGALGLVDIPVSVGLLQLVIALVVTAFVCAMLERGRPGRSIVLMATDGDLAQTLGLGAGSIRRALFVYSAALGAIAGAGYALMFNAVTPDQAGFNLVATVLSLAVIGGLRSWLGCVIGGILVTSAPYWLSGIGEWAQLGYGVLLLIVILWAPSGILGAIRSVPIGSWNRPGTPGVPTPTSTVLVPADASTAKEQA
jgi:branched-chain amino acid transport system permease protein